MCAAFLWEASTQNAFQTTLNGTINDTVQTITLTSVANIVAPGVLVIDRQDGSGNDTPSKREYISYTGINGSDLTGVSRGVAGSTGQSHSSGALVEAIATVTHWGDMVDFLQAEHDSSGKHLIGTATINYTETKNLAVTSVASISASFLSNVTITNSINASGASIMGFFPSGASGSVLTNIGNNLSPVYSTVAGGTGGFNALFQVPGGLASIANIGGLIPVPTSFSGQFLQAFVQTPASLASVSLFIQKNFTDYGMVAIPAGATFASSASIGSTALVAGDHLTMDIRSTASMAVNLSVLLRAT